jgi:SAM-dependent methyltransferase
MSTYLLENAAAPSQSRLDSLEYCFDGATRANIEALGISKGWRCLEVGSGNGSIAHWLAERVGPTGTVIATDIDPSLMRPPVGNLEIRQHDIVTDELPAGHFDLVHARLVLLHLPQRQQVVERIFHALKPGGYLLIEDFDVTWQLPVLASPDKAGSELFWKVVNGIHELLCRAGMDLAWAREAYESLKEVGYTQLGYRGFCDVWKGGSIGASLHHANAMQVAENLIANGMATEQELDAFSALTEDPRFAVSSYLMLATWGRRPTG